MKTYAINLIGLTPMLMHWDNIDWADFMDEWLLQPENKQRSKPGDDRTPPFKWLGCLYHDGERVVIPRDNISTCLMQAGAKVPTGKKALTFKSMTQSGMQIAEEFVPLHANGHGELPIQPILDLKSLETFPEHIQAVRDLGFELHIKRVSITPTAKHVRVRPIFNAWGLSFHVDVWEPQITKKVLEQILTVAGTTKGLGDWRPGAPRSPGSYGRFRHTVEAA